MRFMTILVACCAVAACSGYGGAAIAGPHTAEAQHACQKIGLHPNNVEYFNCVQSLEQTAAEVDGQARAEQASAACLNDKLSPGSAAFANCVLDRVGVVP